MRSQTYAPVEYDLNCLSFVIGLKEGMTKKKGYEIKKKEKLSHFSFVCFVLVLIIVF